MHPRALARRFARFRRRGDPGDLAAVFDATAPEILRVAAHLARTATEAEDLLQRTFVSAIEAARTWDRSRPLLPWLLGILANHAKEAARAQARSVDPARLAPRGVEDPSEAAARAEAVDATTLAIDALKDPVRGILRLRYRHGLEPAEIALALGMPPATVRSHLHRGLEAIRRSAPGVLAFAGGDAGPVPRGLAAVRRVVVARAAEVGPELALAAGGGAASVVVLGGLVMQKKVLGLATALVLLAGGTTVLVTSPGLLGPGSRDAPVPARLAEAPAPPDLASLPRPASAKESAPAPDPVADPVHGSLEVRILSRTGASLPDEPFVLVPRGDPYSLDYRVRRTDAQGRSLVDGLDAGRWLVLTGRTTGAYATVVAGGVTPLELRVKRGVDVEGVVVDAAGAPVAGAVVWTDREMSRSYGMLPVARTDARGRFRLEDLDPYTGLCARAPDHAPSGVRRLVLGAGKTETVRLALGGPAGLLRGRVVDAKGDPVAGAFVLVGTALGTPRDLPDGTQGTEPLPRILTADAEGRFEADGMPVGATHVTVRAPGRGPLRQTRSIDPAPPATEWTLALPEAREITGIVLDAEGAPVGGAWIASAERHDPSWTWTTTTGADGRFRLEGVSLEAARAMALRATEATKGQATFTVGPEPGEVVVRLAPWVRILVRVLDERGSPIPGRTIQARTPRYPLGKTWATTDTHGRVTLEVGEDDEYEVVVLDPDGADVQPSARRRGVRPGTEEVTLTVRDTDRPTCRIVGEVVGPGGTPPEGMNVWAMPVAGPAGIHLTADPATGRIESPRLQPGRYDVSLSAPGFGTVALARLRLVRGQVSDLGRIRLETPGSLVVRLQGRNALVVSGGGIVAESSRGTVWARPDGAGVTRFAFLQPGRHVVVVGGVHWSTPPTAAASVPVTVESGKETTVEIPESRGHVRRIQVEGLSAAEADGLSLRVHAEGGEAPLLRAEFGTGVRPTEAPETQGAFAPGRYVVEAVTADGRSARATFDVAGDGEPAVVVAGFR